MRAGWKVKTLGDLCQVIGGGTPSKDKAEYYSGKIPWATVRDMREDVITETECKITKAAVASSATNIIPRGNVVIATRVGLGKVCMVGEDTAINQDLRGIVPIDQNLLSVNFLFWWFKSVADLIVAEGTGATVQGVKLPFVKSLQVPLPPLAEQQRIVGILNEASEGIATAKANAEKNLQNARALFESHLQSIFTQRSEGWLEKSLGDVCEYVNGKAHEQCIDAKGRFIVINSRFISSNGEIFKKSDQALLLLRRGDIAMVLSDVPNGKALAKCYLVEQDGTYTLNQRICLIRSAQFHPKFLYYQLNRNRHFLAFDNGENQTNLRQNQVLSCPLFIPLISEQKSIAAALDTISNETEGLATLCQRKIDALDALRNSLLHHAFSGQL
jgi:type I restriction enzyme, S subunit